MYTDLSSALVAVQPGDSVILMGGNIYSGIRNCGLAFIVGNISLIGDDSFPGSTPPVIDCNGGLGRCLNIVNVNNIYVSKVVLKNGNAPNAPSMNVANRKLLFSYETISAQDTGGCVLISGSQNVIMDRVNVSGCKASHGGGISVLSSTNFTLTGSTIANNRIIGSLGQLTLHGAGCYFQLSSMVTIRDSKFYNNMVYSTFLTSELKGGALLAYKGSISIVNVDFYNNSVVGLGNNSALYGGGIAIENATTVLIVQSSFSYNIVQNRRSDGWMAGGGIYISATQSICELRQVVSMRNQLLSTIQGDVLGAGIYLDDTPNVILTLVTSRGNAVVVAKNNGIITGSGMYLTTCDSVIAKNVDVSENLVQATDMSYGQIQGVGIYCDSSSYYYMVNSSVSGNIINSRSGIFNIQGVGCYFALDVYVALEGVTIAHNVGNILYPGAETTPPYVPVRTNATKHCDPSVLITATSGVITDGSVGTYSNSMLCTWTIRTATVIDQAFNVFKASFTAFDIEFESTCSYDYVAVFDGPSSFSPMLGKYCGSLGGIRCASRCVDPNDIVSSGAALTILFASDINEVRKGFSLAWEFVPATNRVGTFGKLLPVSTAISVLGGGAAFVSTDFSLKSCLVHNNSISHPLQAFGAGVSLNYNCMNISVDSSIFSDNVVSAPTAAGAALIACNGATLQLSNSEVSGNRAVATGMCFWSVDGFVRCPSSWGAGIACDSAAAHVTNSILDRNVATCQQTSMCQVQGAAMVVVELGTMTVTSSVCSGNICDCRSAEGCQKGLGGCAYGDSGYLLINGTGSIVKDNTVTEGGGGGGILAMGDVNVTVTGASFFHNNTGKEGGGFRVMESSTVSISNAIFTSNTALSGGGAVAIVDEGALVLQDSLIINNSASRASAILGYNDNDLDNRLLKNLTVTGSVGAFVSVIGKMTYVGVVWNCTFPGSMLTNDSSLEFFSLSCTPCEAGSYSIFAASSLIPVKCRSCVYGAVCLGATNTSNGLLALPGFWGDVRDDRSAVFAQCPFGYCCPANRENCPFDYCAGGRVGRLCGSCPGGAGLRYFTDACGPDSECTDAAWAIPLLLLAAVVVCIVLLLTASNSTTGIPQILLFFYQAFPLLKSTPWKYGEGILVSVLQSIFQVAPPAGGTSNVGICLQPGMDAAFKLSSKILFQLVVFLVFGVVFGAHHLSFNTFQFKWIMRHPPMWTRYLAALVQFLIIAYVTLMLTPLQMVQCIWMDDKYVWWFDATIECYTSWQIAAGFGIIAVLGPVPLAMIVILYKWYQHPDGRPQWQIEIERVLAQEFKPNRRWWAGASLYRLLLLVIVYATIVDRNWQSMAFTVLCFIFMMLQLLLKPFRNKLANQAEALSLLILGILSATSAPQLSRLQYASAVPLSDEDSIEGIQIFLVILPICIAAVIMVISFLKSKSFLAFKNGRTAAFRKNRQSSHTNNDHGARDGEDMEVQFEDLEDVEGIMC